MHPFNGDYYDSSGNVRNLMEVGSSTGQTAKDSMMPFNGDFYASDGSIHNVDELIGSGTGGQGLKGDKGEDGKSAYEIALENGFTGTEEEWLIALKGERGVGIFYMRINENGELILGATDEESKPPLSINEEGYLIYTI